MCELILSLDDSKYWKKDWKLGDTNGKKFVEIYMMVCSGLNKETFYKSFRYDRILLKMPDGNIMIVKDATKKYFISKK